MAYTVIILALTSVVVFVLSPKLSSYVRARRFIKKHGCEPAPRLPQSERIIGYSLLQEQKNAFRDKKSLEVTVKRYQENGNTWVGIP